MHFFFYLDQSKILLFDEKLMMLREAAFEIIVVKSLPNNKFLD